MPLETNFNAAPYFDDYDANNNFYRVLFKPGTAVQARELTQLQTILQDQIEKFGRHIFKEGSIVEGCTINFDPNYKFVKVRDLNSVGSIINVNDFVGNKLVSTANLQAVIVKTVNGLESNNPDLNTLYIKYLNSAVYANGSQQKTFDPNEQVSVYTIDDVLLENLTIANSSFNPIGTGFAMSISEGTIFSKGFFIRIEPQTVILSKYSSTPSDLSVGFYTNELIVSADSDSSLFDNSIGSPNFNAPGANRIKLVSNLVTRALDTTNTTTANTDNFFSIIDIKDGSPIIRSTDPQYARLGDEMARRTYEESGDYIVDPFELSTTSNTINSNNLVLEVGSGIGYVRGYRVQFINTNRFDVRKGTDTLYFPNQIITTNYGNYVYVNELAGPFDTFNLDEIGLYATAATKLTSGNYSTSGTEPATKIGTAKIRNVEYYAGTPGTPTCEYKIYLFDVRITAPGFDFSDVRSFYATDGNGIAAYADAVLVSGSAVLRETAAPTLVYSLGRSALQSVNTTATSFFYRTKTTRTFQSNGTATLTPPTSHPGGQDTIALTGSLSEANELKFIVIANTAANAVNVAAVTVSVNTSSPNVNSSASFTSNFAAGDYVAVGNSSTSDVRRVVSITNTTHMVVNSNFSFTNSAVNICRHFPAGAAIPFTREDSANVVVAVDGSSATFNLGTNLASTFVSTIYYDVFRNQAVEAKKVINKNRFIKIDAATHPNLNQGPWSLGLPDVVKIRAIYQGNSYSTSNRNVTSLFVLNTGQDVGYYGLSNIAVRPGSGHSVGTSDKLLIEVDHFTSDYSGGIGYFSINSYPIDDANTSNTQAITTAEIPIFISQSGTTYDLRDSVDFRVYSSNTANSATIIGDATENPSSNVSLLIDSDGAYVPTNDENFNTAFTYYLGRKVKVALSPEGDIDVIDGAPSSNPAAPRDLDGSMTLGLLTIPPYPSLSQFEARLSNRFDYAVGINLLQNRRYTMRDIGVIDKKLSRLEYYTSLSLLEASTKTLIIKDDTGAERFKNGFIVDPFRGFTVSDTSNPEYKAAIDIKLQELQPTISRTYVDLYFDAAASSNVAQKGNLILLSGNTIPYIEQPFASKVRNCTENINYVWSGNIQLSPEGDSEPDIFRNPDVISNIDLSGITDFINGLPNLVGTERVVATTTNFNRSTVTDSRRVNTIAGQFDEFGRNIRIAETTDIATIQNEVIAATTTNTFRTDLDLSASNLDTSFNLGEIVQDVSIQPFIRPRRIRFTATNVKPNSIMYAFFDGKPVSVHCTQTDSSFIPIKDKGDSLISDSVGILYGYFDIPDGIFKVGDRVFTLYDVEDLTVQGETITTRASATYSASNISITKARYQLNTRIPQPSFTVNETLIDSNTTENVISRTTITTRNTVARNVTVFRDRDVDPIAQTFYINDIEAGVFLEKIDLFFRSKHPTLGVEIQIREVENGFPTLNILPFGRKVLTAAQVNVSNDASAVTTFEFDSPVFLKGQTEYCFVVMPVGSNDGYNIWVGEIGGVDVRTNAPIYDNNSTGVLFTSSTNRVWTPFQKEDIKFVLYRRQMNVSSGLVTYRNANNEYLTVDDFGGAFTVGEKVYVSNGAPVITSNAVTDSTNTVSVIANATSNAQTLFTNGSYIYVSSNTGDVTEVRYITNIPNTTHLVLDSALTFNDSNASVGILKANGQLYGQLLKYSENDGLLYLEGSTANSTSGFTNVATGSSILIGSESKAKANLISVDDVVYSTVMGQFSYVSPPATFLTLRMKGTTGTVVDPEYTQINSDLEQFFTDKERKIKSYSNELQSGSGKSLEVVLRLNSTTTKLSPFVDDIKSNILVFKNIINSSDQIGDETISYGANADAKYISKRVVLGENQDAEDLNIYLSAYKPSNTNIYVYAKFLNADDSDLIDNKAWTPMNQSTSESTISSRANRNDFREYLYETSFRYSVNASSSTAMSDYTVYGSFSNTDISANNIAISNSVPLPIGTLVYYLGDVASISNGFYTITTANTTSCGLSIPGTSTVLTINPGSSTETANLYIVPHTAFKDRNNNNLLSYYSNTGALFISYKTFSIKTVLTAEEGSHLVPRLSDMRAVALQA